MARLFGEVPDIDWDHIKEEWQEIMPTPLPEGVLMRITLFPEDLEEIVRQHYAKTHIGAMASLVMVPGLGEDKIYEVLFRKE